MKNRTAGPAERSTRITSRSSALVDHVPNPLPISVGTLGLKASSDRLDGPQPKGPPPGSTLVENAAQALVDQLLEGGSITCRHLPRLFQKGVSNLDCRLHVADNIGVLGGRQRKIQKKSPLLRYCARPPFALERLSVIRGSDGRISRIRSVLPRH